MKSNMVAFWTWNKRESRMSLTPKRTASGKEPFNQRVLQSLTGKLMYRKAAKFMRKLARNKREARLWAEKMGRRA